MSPGASARTLSELATRPKREHRRITRGTRKLPTDRQIRSPRERLLQHLGIETPVDLLLVGWVAISLECGDQSTQSRREDDQITGIITGAVGVGYARPHENRRSGTHRFASVGIAKSQFAVQNVPRFVIAVVDVKRGGTATAPFMDCKRGARSTRVSCG